VAGLATDTSAINNLGLRVTLPFFTIGHSNRTLEEFVALLGAAEIGLVADIRRIPRSRANPQFNEDTLPAALAGAEISYERVAALGGLRRKARTVAPEINGFWTNQSFHNYADYALSNEFHAGLEHVIAQGRERRCVVMCSEAVWWRCHRRIVADHLIAHGETVFHIMGESRLERAQLSAGAVAEGHNPVFYPASTGPE
jgi:uncharacterized protein (DUF488 family)